jgi:hypothetical protein
MMERASRGIGGFSTIVRAIVLPIPSKNTVYFYKIAFNIPKTSNEWSLQ